MSVTKNIITSRSNNKFLHEIWFSGFLNRMIQVLKELGAGVIL